MTKLRRAALIATIGAVTLAGCSRSPARDQTAGKAGPQCGPPGSWPGLTMFTVVNSMDGARKSCRFFSHTLLPLETGIGSNAEWLICNQCDLDVKVVLDQWDVSDWADSFDYVIPTQVDTRSLEVTVRAHDAAGSVRALRALDSGEFRYKVHAIPAGYVAATDTIESQLQIKRTGGLVNALLSGLISVLIGLGVGFWLGRRRRAATL